MRDLRFWKTEASEGSHYDEDYEGLFVNLARVLRAFAFAVIAHVAEVLLSHYG